MSARAAACLTVVLLAARCGEASQAAQLAVADAGPRWIYRLEDAGQEDPVLAVSGIWTALPTGRASMGLAFYSVQVIIPAEGGPTAHVGIGILDGPGAQEPVIASLCGNCYDGQRGVPPPDGWSIWGNHGRLTGRTEFVLNYDVPNARWAWYVNGQVVRLESSPLVGPGLRVIAGATLDGAEEPARTMRHHNLQLRTGQRGLQLFEPEDGLWPQTTVASGVVRYDADGTVTLVAEETDVAWPEEPGSGITTVRGGSGGAVVPFGDGAALLAGRGVALQLVDVGGDRDVSTLAVFTSTVSALNASTTGAFIGLHDGRIVRFNALTPPGLAQLLELRAPVAAIAAGPQKLAVGSETGEMVVLDVDPPHAVLGRVHLHGRVRDIAWVSGKWLVALETIGYGAPLGRVSEVAPDVNGQLSEGISLPFMSGPVAMLSMRSTPGIVIGLASGELRLLDMTDDALADAGSLIVLPTALHALAGDDSDVYAVDETGGVWVLNRGDARQLVIADHAAVGLRGGAACVAEGALVITSDSGELVALRIADDLPESPLVLDQDVGAVVDVSVGSESTTVLTDRWALQSIPLEPLAATVPRTTALPWRAIALRSWEGGLALTNGLAGLDLYGELGEGNAVHVPLTGISRDVVVEADVAYVAAGAVGVHVVDMASWRQPRLARTIATEYVASSVGVLGSVLLVGQLGGDMLAFDRSDQLELRPLGAVTGTPDVIRIVADDDGVFALNDVGWLYDLAMEESGAAQVPALQSALRVTRSGLDVEPVRNAVLVAGGRDGLKAVGLHDEKEHVTAIDIPGDSVMVVSAAGETVEAGLGASGLFRWRRSGSYPLYLPIGQLH